MAELLRQPSKSERPTSRARLRAFIARLKDSQPITRTVDRSRRWRSQKQHWLNWLAHYDGPGHYGRACWDRDAAFVYRHIGCAPMLLWLVEASGIPRRQVLHAKRVILKTSNQAAACAAIRRIVPWNTIQQKLGGGRRRSR